MFIVSNNGKLTDANICDIGTVYIRNNAQFVGNLRSGYYIYLILFCFVQSTWHFSWQCTFGWRHKRDLNQTWWNTTVHLCLLQMHHSASLYKPCVLMVDNEHMWLLSLQSFRIFLLSSINKAGQFHAPVTLWRLFPSCVLFQYQLHLKDSWLFYYTFVLKGVHYVLHSSTFLNKDGHS